MTRTTKFTFTHNLFVVALTSAQCDRPYGHGWWGIRTMSPKQRAQRLVEAVAYAHNKGLFAMTNGARYFSGTLVDAACQCSVDWVVAENMQGNLSTPSDLFADIPNSISLSWDESGLGTTLYL